MPDIKIVVATHKEYELLKQNYLFPVHVGAKQASISLPYQRDDEGDNISVKNKYYCELTGLYWAYKNLKADYIGLCHYRRYFNLDNIDVGKYELILPKKRHYYIETVYSQFKHAHGSLSLDLTRNIIEKNYPEYLDAFDLLMNSRSLHLYNMFIMKYDIFIDYCDFLFNVLNELEKQLGNIDRIYGYVGERLLDVYIIQNNIEYKEVSLINTEKTNWPKKITNFLIRKIKG